MVSSVLGGRERVGRVVGALDLADLDAVDDRAEAGLGVVGLRLGAGQEVEEGLRAVGSASSVTAAGFSISRVSVGTT